MAKIMIALPTTGSVLTPTAINLCFAVEYLRSVFDEVELAEITSADIAMSRNYLASKAIASKADSLLFIDSDMTFSPGALKHMIDKRADVVGAICPKRVIDLTRIVEAARSSKRPAAQVIASTLAFTGEPPPGETSLTFKEGFCRLGAIGMGVTLIAVSALRTMVDNGACLPRKLPVATPFPTWGFFDHLEEDGVILSEDYSFCHRWVKQCGGQIWGISSLQIGHIASVVLQGQPLLD